MPVATTENSAFTAGTNCNRTTRVVGVKAMVLLCTGWIFSPGPGGWPLYTSRRRLSNLPTLLESREKESTYTSSPSSVQADHRSRAHRAAQSSSSRFRLAEGIADGMDFPVRLLVDQDDAGDQ